MFSFCRKFDYDNSFLFNIPPFCPRFWPFIFTKSTFFLEWQYNLVVKNMSLKFWLFKILASKYLTALTLNFLTYEIGIIIKKNYYYRDVRKIKWDNICKWLIIMPAHCEHYINTNYVFFLYLCSFAFLIFVLFFRSTFFLLFFLNFS